MTAVPATAPDVFDMVQLPRLKRGRQTAANEAEYLTQCGTFCRLILQIRSTMDFEVGARG
jgi:hypothetical protein